MSGDRRAVGRWSYGREPVGLPALTKVVAELAASDPAPSLLSLLIISLRDVLDTWH